MRTHCLMNLLATLCAVLVGTSAEAGDAGTIACDSNYDCGVSEQGTCVAGTDATRRTELRWETGPVCYCHTEKKVCESMEVNAPSCRTDSQCGLEIRNGFRVPVRLKTPRTRKLHPCEGDGSHIPACEKGRCTARIYKC